MSLKPQIATTLTLIGIVVGCSEPTTSPNTTTTSEIRRQIESPTEVKVIKKQEPISLADPKELTWGHLKGRFVYGGEPPRSMKIVVTKDQVVCGKHELFNEAIVVDSETKGIRNVVVQLYLKRGAKRPPIHEAYEATANDKIKLDNSSCRFDGHVVGIRTSQTLHVRNLDAVGHNTKIDAVSNAAINPILPAYGEIEHQFTNAERTPVPVSCSIHPWMNGYLVVQDHPYFAVTNEKGEFEIRNLPTGTWTFQVWHEKAKFIKEVTIDGATTAWKRGRFDQEVNGKTVDLGDIIVGPNQFD